MTCNTEKMLTVAWLSVDRTLHVAYGNAFCSVMAWMIWRLTSRQKMWLPKNSTPYSVLCRCLSSFPHTGRYTSDSNIYVTYVCFTRNSYRTSCHYDEYHAILVLINNLASIVSRWRSCEFMRRTWHYWHKIYSFIIIIIIMIIIIIIIFINCNWFDTGGSGYFTCIQNIKLVTTKFKSGGLHEKRVVFYTVRFNIIIQ
jgi:hypothetical protein